MVITEAVLPTIRGSRIPRGGRLLDFYRGGYAIVFGNNIFKGTAQRQASAATRPHAHTAQCGAGRAGASSAKTLNMFSRRHAGPPAPGHRLLASLSSSTVDATGSVRLGLK